MDIETYLTNMADAVRRITGESGSIPALQLPQKLNDLNLIENKHIEVITQLVNEGQPFVVDLPAGYYRNGIQIRLNIENLDAGYIGKDINIGGVVGTLTVG